MDIPERMALNSRLPISWIVLFVLFFAICFGLGYATLNRYDPREREGTSDSKMYCQIVTGKPSDATPPWRYRVLVPYLAKPIYKVAQGHMRTWDPVLFSMLISNSIFCSGSAVLLMILGLGVGVGWPTALMGALIFLLNFNVTNIQLAGMVDSSELFCIMLVTLALFSKKWVVLPFLGILSGLAKETAVPLAFVTSFIWWCATRKGWASFVGRRSLLSLAFIVGMGVAGVVTVSVVQSWIEGHLVLPWNYALGQRRVANFSIAIMKNSFGHGVLYPFYWLLPLGAWRLRSLPRPWVLGSAGAVLTALALGAWHMVGSGNIARPMFNVAGPLLSLSAACFLVWIATGQMEPKRAPLDKS